MVVGSREQGILFCFLSLRPLLRLVGQTSHRTVCAGRPDTPASDLDTFDITSTGQLVYGRGEEENTGIQATYQHPQKI